MLCAQVEQVAGLSSNLTSLALRLHPQEVPSDGLWHLAGCMTQLQELSLCPLPEACTPPDLRQLLEMPRLARLQLGTRDAAQVGGGEAVLGLFHLLQGPQHAGGARPVAAAVPAAAVKHGACCSRFPCSSAGCVRAVDGSGRCCCLALPLQVMLLNDVRVPRSGPQLSLLVRDACEPGPAADILTVIGWTLPQHLTALSIGPLAAPCPNDVLVTLATLVNLQHLELQVGRLLFLVGLVGQRPPAQPICLPANLSSQGKGRCSHRSGKGGELAGVHADMLPCACLAPAVCRQLVAPPGQHVSGTVELLTLSPCRQLTCLEVLTSSRLYVPFTLKTVSLATLAWPKLAALRLSLAGAARLPVRHRVWLEVGCGSAHACSHAACRILHGPSPS